MHGSANILFPTCPDGGHTFEQRPKSSSFGFHHDFRCILDGFVGNWAYFFSALLVFGFTWEERDG